MNDDQKVLAKWGVLAGVVFVAVVFFFAGIGKSRHANALEETLKQEEKTYVNKLEKITRVISSKYQVAQQYPEQLNKVIATLAKPRESGGGLSKSVVEQNNVFSEEMLRDVSRAVESNRTEFEYAFKSYADHAREYNTLIRDPIWSMFIGRRERVDPEPIISDRTAEAAKTRRSNQSDFDGIGSK